MTEKDPLDDVLERLPGEEEPPPGIEDRVVAALRARGAFGPRRTTGAARWLGIAAALLAAFVAGRATAPEPFPTRTASEASGGEYLLLLSALPDETADSALEASRVAEYAAWAGGLAREGRLMAAEKLAARDLTLSLRREGALDVDPAPRGAGPSGFFVIRARSLDQAVEIAGSCPHLRHGGSVSVRPVDPT